MKSTSKTKTSKKKNQKYRNKYKRKPNEIYAYNVLRI